MKTNLEAFVFETCFEDLPLGVRKIIQRSILDTIGVAAIGSQSELSKITSSYAKDFWRAGSNGPYARLPFDGTQLSPSGSAFAGAFMLDSIDAHDGHSPVKGHAGSAIFPALLGFCETRSQSGDPVSGQEFITAMAIGYEIAYRSGLTQHATCEDYHTSGAWTAVGVAAMGSRLLKLSSGQMLQAIGIAEYHGPRSQMMRCIDHPTMVRDGVGWGAPVGVDAVYMAQSGFTGAPAVTVISQEAQQFWHDLGTRWEIENTHYKRYPVCRWAHPAIDAAQELMLANDLTSQEIKSVKIQTFHNAIRLAGNDPKTMDELAYGIAFPTAIMIVRGKIGPSELSTEVLEDPEIKRISMATKLVETDHYNKISIGVRWADVSLTLQDGTVIQSEPRKPKGDPDDPLSDDEISQKFHLFADSILGKERADHIEDLVGTFHGQKTMIGALETAIYQPLHY
ncbi:MAG: MmgE/PrpD family protein [Salaquimonas sp.]